MTAIIPRLGVRARRRTRGFVVFTVLVILLAFFGVPGPALAANDADDKDDTGSIELYVSTGTSPLASTDDQLLASVTTVNGTEEELSAGRLLLELNRTPLTDDAAIDTWMDSGIADGTFDGLRLEETVAVAAKEEATSSVVVPGTDLGTLAPGVYPLRASLHGATTGSLDKNTLTAQDVTANTVLIVDDGQATSITLVVPITATPTDGGLLTHDELATLTAADGALTAQLNGAGGTGAVLAVDPSIPAAIRALGTAAPATAVDWLSRLEDLPNERIALQFGDADATVQVHAGISPLLGPTSLSSYLDEKNFAAEPAEEDGDGATSTPTATPTASPTPSSTDTAPVLPDDAQLVEMRDATTDVLWPLADVTSEDLTSFTTALGTDATTILPSTAVSDSSSARGVVDGHAVLIADAGISSAFSAAAGEDDAHVRDQDIAQGLAHIALRGETGPLLIALDRDESRSSTALSSVVYSALGAGSGTGLAALRAMPATAVTLTTSIDTGRADSLKTLLTEEGELEKFSTILDDPRVLLGPERIRILRVIAVGAAATFDEAVTTHRKSTSDTLNAVGLQNTNRPVQLFTPAAPLPVWIRNDLPWPVNVRLTAIPDNARLGVQGSTDAVAQPNSNTRITVPVEARVGSGEVDVRFSLSSPTGEKIGQAQTATVTVRADWENIGLGILGALIVLLIGFGVLRTVRRRRREAAASSADADPSPSPSEASPSEEGGTDETS